MLYVASHQRRDDRRVIVRHDADFAQVDADAVQDPGEVMRVQVAGPPGQDFVADDQDGGGGRRGD